MRKKALRRRRFVAKYIRYLTIFGYLFVAVMGVVVAVLWFVKTDEQAVSVGDIEPQESVLKHGEEAVVLGLLVPSNTDVVRGQGLVEISSDPMWIARYRSENPEDPEQLAALRSQVPDESIEVLAAPVSGVAVVWKEAVGKVLPAGSDLAKVIDFADLRIWADFGGTSVTDIEAGQDVKVEPLTTTYGNGETLLSDLIYPGWWRKGRAQFNSVADGKIKGILQRHYEGSRVTLERSGKTEDAPFKLTEVTAVDITGAFRVVDPLREMAPSAIEAEPFLDARVPGTVLVANHRATIKIRDLPDDVMAEIRDTLRARFGGGIRLQDTSLSDVDSLRSKIGGVSFLGRFRSGLREDNTAPLSVLDIENLKVVVSMNAEYKASDEDSTNDAERNLVVERFERNCLALTRLVDPPPGLQAKVRELTFAGSEPDRVSAAVKVVVGDRRIAMLLFRK